MSHRRPRTTVRNTQDFAPLGLTTRYRPLASPCRPGFVTVSANLAVSFPDKLVPSFDTTQYVGT